MFSAMLVLSFMHISRHAFVTILDNLEALKYFRKKLHCRCLTQSEYASMSNIVRGNPFVATEKY